MKLKKGLIIAIIISITLMFIPTEVFAWLAKDTYEACNIINMCISGLMRMTVFIITISFITLSIRHIRYSEKETKQKAKNILIWLVITIIQITILLLGATWVTQVGMETYWSTGERYQFHEIDGYISYAIRIVAMFLIVFYIIKSFVYWVQSEKEDIQKIINLAKWQMITATVVVILLILATNW